MRKINKKNLGAMFGQEKYAIKCDKFDIDDFQDIKSVSSKLLKSEKEGNEALPTFSDLMQDTFSLLNRLKPELVDDFELDKDHLLNHAIMDQMQEHRRVKEMRALSRGDSMISAVGVESLSEELVEIAKKLQEQMAKAQAELDEALEAAEKAAQEAAEGEGQGDGSGEGGEEGDGKESPGHGKEIALEEAKKRLEEAKQQIQDLTKTDEFKQSMGNALARVKHKVVQTSNTIREWGLGADSDFKKSDHRAKLDLLHKLQDSPKLKKVAQMAGRLTDIALSQQSQKIKRGFEEVYSVQQGRDLSRLLPQEILKLLDDDREFEFLKNWSEAKTLEYALKGKEKKAKGAIVVAIDESGSMQGENEVWSKAVAMALLNIAIKQKRSFHVIHFNGNRNPKSLPTHDFPKNENVSKTKIIEMVEYFMGGGTDFEAPLTRARMAIEEQREYHKADIIFITDGSCAVSDSWLQEYKEWKKANGVAVYSILMDSAWNSDASLKEFSNTIYKLSNFTTDSENMAMDLFYRV